MVLLKRQRVYLSGLKDTFQVFDQLMILSRSVEREEAAVCLFEGGGMSRQRVTPSANIGDFPVSEIIYEDQK